MPAENGTHPDGAAVDRDGRRAAVPGRGRDRLGPRARPHGVGRGQRSVRALVVADEVHEALWTDRVADLGVDLVLAAGDLPADYLDHLSSVADRPVVFVPGNHDPDFGGLTRRRGLPLRAGFPCDWPGPAGGVNADTRVVEVAGLRIAGLGGSPRYTGGPNQWTERAQARRARRLVRRARRRPVDVLLTHTPPRGAGDADDPPHQGFACLHRVVRALDPRWLLHGHVEPEAPRPRTCLLGDTRVCNVVGARVFELGVPRGRELW